ncbi:cupin domain-containing protein [Candidatus Magnetaquicoccus inordinatus]|uniref:cupin domain-containing protein n=1 Tax=Candidatus Magnetaquicoccus inordinatus TaxID=2496818 RepID=UPI00102C4B10|nr:cupin domain-containing protein [Candidatus Magnetaquicoccus inordinatus]
MQKLLQGVVAALFMLLAIGLVQAEEAYRQVQPLLHTAQSVLGEPLLLADGTALQITSTIVTIAPGEKTAWHKHGVPLYAYILSGAVTIDYGEQGTRCFTPGMAFMEAMDHWHRGTNQGEEPVRILAVYLGTEKSQLVIPKP